ncbi:MAG TPA: hypothetical protein VHP36_04905 [Chitinispirillaceae bacterium]|nr:hypothetical protein [Chitinispirillaceae bacterium]
MKITIINIPALNSDQFQDELNQFISSHKIVSIDKEFVSNGSSSFWPF